MSFHKELISLEEAKAIVSQVYTESEDFKILEHYLEPYCKDKVGSLGTHQRLKISVSKNDELINLNFFVKSVPKDSKEQINYVKYSRVFNQEAEFFNKVMPQLLDAVSIGKIDSWAPKCYLANDNLVVLDDLKDKGFAMSEDKILKADKLKATVKAMAHLHAASFLTESKLGEPLNKVYPHACVEQIFNGLMRQQVAGLYGILIEEVAKKHSRSAKHIRKTFEFAFNYINNDRDEARVICHGDSWSNNVMLDKSSPPKAILVDYQLVRYAPRMIDVSVLMYTSTTRDMRNKDEREVIECYYKELCDTLKRCDPSYEIPTFEKIKEEYEDARVVGLAIAIIYYPSILLSKKVLDEYKNDSATLYRKFIFRRSNDDVLDLMEKDKTYGDRITEAILEFLEVAEKIATA